MKISTSLHCCGVATAIALGLLKASAELEVSATVQIHAKAEFDAPLAPYGTWVQVGSYGRCWHPVGVAAGWRPYCSGEWVWTDCGWYWASDEPWAWACYHYGSWVYDPRFGWVWIPDIDWAPAWVSWRFGGGFVGWAPLPPQGFFFASRPKPELFVFVDAGRISDPVRPSSVLVKSTAIFSKTSEVGGIKGRNVAVAGSSSQRVLFARGPELGVLQKASGKPVWVVPIREAMTRTHAPGTTRVKEGGVANSKKEHDDLAGRSAPEPDRGTRDALPEKEHFAPPSDNSWSSFGPGRGNGNGNGNGGGGHGKGKGSGTRSRNMGFNSSFWS